MAQLTATKTIKLPRWAAAGIHALAEKEGYPADGQWLRKIILERIEAEGFTADNYDPFTDEVIDFS